MAVHAGDVLAARAEVRSLDEAVADCGFVIGTSGRDAVRAAGGETPRALAAEILAACAANDVALVFGPEDHGLSTEELARCQRVLAIPASDAYGSLNLAQAVLVCAYEIFLAAAAANGSPSSPPRTLATSTQTELMYSKLEAALRRIGFLQPDSAAHVMRRLRRMLGRAGLDDDEAQILLGVARQIDWVASRAGLQDDERERQR